MQTCDNNFAKEQNYNISQILGPTCCLVGCVTVGTIVQLRSVGWGFVFPFVVHIESLVLGVVDVQSDLVRAGGIYQVVPQRLLEEEL